MFLRQKPAHEQKTKELAEAIRESKAFQTYKEAARELRRNEEVKQIATKITKLRIKIINDKATKEDKTKHKQLIKQYKNLPAVNTFMKARQDMEEIAKKVNTIISNKINRPFLYKVGGGTCSGI